MFVADLFICMTILGAYLYSASVHETPSVNDSVWVKYIFINSGVCTGRGARGGVYTFLGNEMSSSRFLHANI